MTSPVLLRFCPLCGAEGTVEPCSDLQQPSDLSESFPSSHRCSKCARAFRFTPAEKPFNSPRLGRTAA